MDESEPAQVPEPRARPTLIHLLYVTAVIASAVSLIGFWGMALGATICVYWYYIYFASEGTQLSRFVRASMAALLLCCIGCCVLMPAVSAARAAARRMQCSNNLKMISLGLLNYESFYGSLPPAITYAADGTPLHSWRVLVLPYLEQQNLYKRYRFDEPWNGPNNSALLKMMPSVYRCPEFVASSSRANAAFETSYCAVSHPRSCFPPDHPRKLGEILDGSSNTVAVVEYDGSGITWMAPVDPNLEAYLQHCQTWGPSNPPRHSHKTRFEHVFLGENVAFADGSVHFLGYGLPAEALEQMLLVDDGVFDFSSWRSSGAYRQIRIDGYISLAMLVVLAVLPAFWLRKNQ